MEDKPFNLKVRKSRGKTVYLDNLRLFEDKGVMHITHEKSHTFCPKGSSIEKFFKRIYNK